MHNNELKQSIENWLPVRQNTSYEISDLGRLRHTYLNGKTLILTPKTNGGKSKYQFNIIDYKKYYRHKLVLQEFVSDVPDGYECDHIDRNPENNHLCNLRYQTINENRSLKGEEHANAKLCDEKVRVIRLLYHRGMGLTHKDIGDLFNVTSHTVGDVLRGRSWRHVV